MARWAKDREQALRLAWANGDTISVIASAFNTSRGGIARKARQLDLPRRDAREATRAYFAKRRAEGGGATARQRQFNPGPKRKAKTLCEQKKPEAVTPLNTPFLARTRDQCKAITDPTRSEQKCCGHAVDLTDPQMRGYCAYHRSIYYIAKGKAR